MKKQSYDSEIACSLSLSGEHALFTTSCFIYVSECALDCFIWFANGAQKTK